MEMLYTLNSMFNFTKNSLILLLSYLITCSYIFAQEDSYYENYNEEEVPLIDSDRLLEFMTQQLIEQQIKHKNALLSWEINMPEIDVWMKESEYQELLNQWRSSQPKIPITRFKLDVDIPIGCKKRVSVACYDVEKEAIIIDHKYSNRHGTKSRRELVTELSLFDSSLSNEGELLVEHKTQEFSVPRDIMREYQQDIKLYAVVSNGVYRNEMADYTRLNAWIEVKDWILKNKDKTVSFKISVDLVPLFKVAPVYPRRAQERGISGYVIVGFTINESGSIENPYVIEGKCRSYLSTGDYQDCSVFNAATLKAAEKLKYKPVIRNGKAVAVEDVPHKFTYLIDPNS